MTTITARQNLPASQPLQSVDPCAHGCDYCRTRHALVGATGYSHPCTLVREARQRASAAEDAYETACDADPRVRRVRTLRLYEERNEAEYAVTDAIDHYRALIEPPPPIGRTSSWGAPVVRLTVRR